MVTMGVSEELLNCIFGDSARGRILSFMLKTGGSYSKADLMSIAGVCPRTLESCLRKLKANGILVEEGRRFRINARSRVGRALQVLYQEILCAEAEVSGHHEV